MPLIVNHLRRCPNLPVIHTSDSAARPNLRYLCDSYRDGRNWSDHRTPTQHRTSTQNTALQLKIRCTTTEEGPHSKSNIDRTSTQNTAPQLNTYRTSTQEPPH